MFWGYTNVSVNVQKRKTIQPLNIHSTAQVCLYASKRDYRQCCHYFQKLLYAR